MAKYINVENLLLSIKKNAPYIYHTVAPIAFTIPPADVAPVVHARWDKDNTCTECGRDAFYTEWTEPKWDYDWDENLVQVGDETHFEFILSPYCPNCGARMDG